MTSAIVASRPRAFLIIGPNEEKNKHVLFAFYQKSKYPDHLVRVIRQLKGEDIWSCLQREKILKKWITERSVLILCNGKNNTTTLPAAMIQTYLGFCPYKRPHISLEERALNVRLAFTKTGKYCVPYFNESIYSERWKPFYNRSVSAEKLLNDFSKYYEGKPIHVSVDQRSLVRNLLGLFPNMHSGKQRDRPIRFSSKIDCLEQWEKTKEAMGKKKPLSCRKNRL